MCVFPPAVPPRARVPSPRPRPLLRDHRLGEVVSVLRRRLETASFRVQFLVLTLVETLVQNCGIRFHRALANEKFLNQMKAVIKVSAPRRVCACLLL